MFGQGAGAVLKRVYDVLLHAYGPQHWWPAKTPTEVVIGAILTQNTAWRNVERAMENLRQAGCLTWESLGRMSEDRLAELIRPSGTFRVKAARLAAFVRVLREGYGGSLDRLLAGPLDEVRRRLLTIHGIGPETADAILLYAGGRPAFVVDAYTRRVLRRHFVTAGRADYETAQRLFQEALPPDAAVYNEYHALLVAVGKRHCRALADCEGCPLAPMPHDPKL